MRTSSRSIATLVATVLVIGVSTAHGTPEVPDETPLTAPVAPVMHPWAIAFLPDGNTLVQDRPDRAGGSRVLVLDPEGNVRSTWPSPPVYRLWNPTSTAVDVRRGQVYIGSGDEPLGVFRADTSWVDWFKVPPRAAYFVVRHLGVGPDGTVYGADSNHVIHRWSPDGRTLSDINDPGPTQVQFQRLVADPEGGLLLAKQTRDGSEIAHLTPGGARLDTTWLTWPVAAGPHVGPASVALDGWATSVGAGFVAVDIVPADNVGARDGFAELGRFSATGEARGQSPLWRYDWREHPNDVPMALADDGLVAVRWAPDSRLDPAYPGSGDAGVTWLAPDGSITAIRRFSANASGFGEAWERVRITGGDRATILFPQTGAFGTLEPDGALSGLRNAPPFAVDVAATDSGTVVLRGWNGLDGTISAYVDGVRLWHERCECRFSEGIAADDQRVYVIDPTSNRLSTFSIVTGEPLSRTEFDVMPMDIAATGDGRVGLALERGGIRLIDGATLATLADWSDDGDLSIRAIAARADQIASLRSDGTVGLRAVDGEQLGRLDVGIGAFDIAFGDDSSLLVLDAEKRTLDRYVAPREEPSGSAPSAPTTCTVRADKTARPQTVFVGEPVTVQISAAIDCPDIKPDVDVVIVWDAEFSWWYQYGWSRNQEAVRDLADLLISRGVRTAVIGGPSGAGVLSPFDAARGDVISAIDAAVRYDFDADKEPDLASLLDASIEYLSVAGRADAAPIVALVGQFGASGDVSGAAEELALRGGKVIALELPSTGNALPRLLAGPAANRYRGVHTRDTAQVAERIREIAEVRVARDVVVRDSLSDAVELLSGSPTGSPVVEGRDVNWRFPNSGSLPASLELQVIPNRTGRHPTNEYGVVEFTEPDGTRVRSELPIPMIDVRTRPAPTYSLYVPAAFAPDQFSAVHGSGTQPLESPSP